MTKYMINILAILSLIFLVSGCDGGSGPPVDNGDEDTSYDQVSDDAVDNPAEVDIPVDIPNEISDDSTEMLDRPDNERPDAYYIIWEYMDRTIWYCVEGSGFTGNEDTVIVHEWHEDLQAWRVDGFTPCGYAFVSMAEGSEKNDQFLFHGQAYSDDNTIKCTNGVINKNSGILEVTVTNPEFSYTQILQKIE